MRIKGTYETSDGYKLTINYNTLAAFEEMTGKPALKFLVALEAAQTNPLALSFVDLRAFYYCALKANHDVTIDEAGELASSNFEALVATMGLAFPQAEEGDAGNGKKPARAKTT